MDGVVSESESLCGQAEQYAEQLATQLRKGFLAYCVLKVCMPEPKYTSDIIAKLRDAEMVVVEGTNNTENSVEVADVTGEFIYNGEKQSPGNLENPCGIVKINSKED